MKYLGVITVCAIAAFLQIHLLEMASGNLQNNLGPWIDAVLRHSENWPGYRSRLLGVGLILAAGGDFQAYMQVTWTALVLAGLLAWRLGGGAGIGILHGCFALFANPWFSPWDMFEPAIFIAFVVLVVEQFSWYWFVGLFAIAIFNLQSAMFIALWMVLSQRMILAGLFCMALGVGVMWYFQHSGLPKLGFGVFQCLDGKTTGYSTDYAQARWVENFHKLFVWDTRAELGVIIIIGFAAVRLMTEQLALGLTFLALLGATVVFGIVDEMRVYLPFIPLFILAVNP